VPSANTAEARTLKASAVRRIWRTMLDYRDWISYIYVPIIVPILVLAPYFVVRFYERSHRFNRLMQSFTQGSPDLEKLSALLDGPSVAWPGYPAEEVSKIDAPDYKGFAVLQDSRIIDLRAWNPTRSGSSDPKSMAYQYRRLKIYKLPENTSNNLFRVRLYSTSPKTAVRFPPQELPTSLRVCGLENASGPEKLQHLEAAYDFTHVRAGDLADVFFDYHSPGLFVRRGENSSTFTWEPEAECGELTIWILMPEKQDYKSYRILRYKTGEPEKMEDFKPVTEFLADDYTILAFKMLSLKHGYTYELTWYYK
jgi:hypothetical protein